MSYLTTEGPIHDTKRWLIGSVCNASRNYWRTTARRQKIEQSVGDALTEQQRPDDHLDRVILLRTMLERLTPRKRDVLRLHYYEGCTAAEIARTLGTSTGYAERLISKALRDLRSMLQATSFPRKE